MLKFFRKSRNVGGQSMVEYALLITLMLAGVMVMGPYVIRSWNANVKGWDDSYRDSFQEPITAAPPAGFDVSCQCQHQDPCSSPPCCGFGTCGETEDSDVFSCNPISCGTGNDICTPNINCCSTPVPGVVPDECGTLADTTTGVPCTDTEVPGRYYCGGEDPNNPTRIVCLYNGNCDFRCLNPPDPVANPEFAPDICPQDDLNLPFDINITFVEPGKCSAPIGSAPKCQWECTGAFVPGFGATSCECPTGSYNDSGTCIIDCGISSGDCQARGTPPPPPLPTGCAGLLQAECTGTYGDACAWSSSGGCYEQRACDQFVTNMTLTSPTGPTFTRCEFFPWCEWVGGGGYCCSAIQHNACLPGLADQAACGGDEVLACCQGVGLTSGGGGAPGSCSRNPLYDCASANFNMALCTSYPGCLWLGFGGQCIPSDNCTYTSSAACLAGAGCIWS